jgi:hypothetical protein
VGPKDTGLDYKVFRVARKLNIPIVSILDAWMNLPGRFLDEKSGDSKAYVPDILCVMDFETRLELINLGIPVEIIVPTGHPYHSDLKSLKNNEVQSREILRKFHNLAMNEKIIVFFSEPLRWAQSELGVTNPGYNEFDAFETLAKGLNSSNRNFTLMVKEHPRKPSLKKFAENYNNNSVRILILENSESDIPTLIMGSDYISGMSTSLLVHSALLGKSILCVQPKLDRENDLNILTKRGLLQNLESVEDVIRIVNNSSIAENVENIRRVFLWEKNAAVSAAEQVINIAARS